MTSAERVAVLGAGVMGSSLALNLARAGHEVTLFDAASQPLTGASRWNEGKIHLGYLYSADASLNTARHIMTGGLMFRRAMESLLERSIDEAVSRVDDLYLCHRESVVSADSMQHYFASVDELVASHTAADAYLEPVGRAHTRRLGASELAAVVGSEQIVAGFRVPERSVNTQWIADRLCQRLIDDPAIELRLGERVLSVAGDESRGRSRWQVRTTDAVDGPFTRVFNALWEGRLAVDQTVGLALPPRWSNRYRLALFLRTDRPVASPCAIVATGPFGDVKNYNDRDFYLSWYPAGLVQQNALIAPPFGAELCKPELAPVSEAVIASLGSLLPWVRDIRERCELMRLEGGWVYAEGEGSLADPSSTLHRRDSYGTRRHRDYLSIDTGKYSTAPWVAEQLIDSL